MRNIGPQSKPFFKFRTSSASKSRLMMRFLVWLLRRHHEKLDAAGLSGSNLLECGLALRRLYVQLSKAERSIDPAACDGMVKDMVRAMRLLKRSSVHQYPKNHMAIHLAEQATFCRQNTRMCAIDIVFAQLLWVLVMDRPLGGGAVFGCPDVD